ncbi:MAG: TetR/AcrR family transcriptional regulator [Mobilitalea sp.]
MINNTDKNIKYFAFKLFLEKGYEATNIRDICKEVEIKSSSLYYYYDSKKELFLRIYDDICDDNIQRCKEIINSNQNNLPNMKLNNLYKGMIKYYSNDIVKQKFLLRYQLFPPEEISDLLRERYNHWTDEENEIIIDIINQCLDLNILSNERTPFDYMLDYKKNTKIQVMEMITTNMKMSDQELDLSWVRLWNGFNMIGGINL